MNRLVVVLIVVVLAVAAFVAIAALRGPRGNGTTTETTGTNGTSTIGTNSTSTTGSAGPSAVMGAPDAASLASAPAPGASYAGLNYCDDGSDGGQQTLDLYYPTTGFSSSLPIVIFVHGGGWKTGSSSYLEPWFKTGLLGQGIAVASINYRLAPTYVFPAQEYDAQCAVAFFRTNSQALGLNPSAIGISGNSAGGQVASWVGVNQSAAFKVVAVGVISAPEDIANFYGDATFSKAVLQVFPTSADKQAGSPVNFVSASTPPFLLEQGYNDTIVPYQQAVEMYNALIGAGATATLVLVNDAGHSLTPLTGYTASPSAEVTQAQMISFFKQQLG